MFYTPVTGFSALHKAAQRGDEEDVAALLAEGADLNARDSEGRTPLHHAVMHGHLGVVDLLLARGAPRLLLAKDILNCTPVHLAAVQNQVTLIIRLVEALLSDVEGRTPLHEVARRRCMQDFMGFLHLGWESATVDDDGSGRPLSELSPLWSVVGSVVDLKRPGLPVVQRVLGWHPLHVAAMSGNIELIRRLVQQFDCDLRVKSMNSWTPLHYAAAYNQVAVIEALISLGCEVAVQDAVGSTPMHVAAGEGHLDAIQALVRLGCSPKVTDRDGCTPLYCAAAWNRIEAVRLLEKLQCPSSLRSLEGRTPVHVAAEQGWVDLIDVLVAELGNQVDARDNYQFTPLHSAANGGHVRAIQRLVQLKHELDAKDYLGRTPLHYAALHGRVKALDELVRQGANVGERDLRGGYTALHLAADTGQCEAIARLVALGAPVDAASSKGVTPLALALMKGPANVDAICLLVELGAEVEHLTEQRGLETPMHIAARSGRLDVIERLVACPQVTVSTRTRDGSTALHYAAAFGQTHVLQALVAAGCDVDSRDSALNTPLHLAAGCGFLDTVVKLVELGADVNARDITDCTPLQNAAHGTYSALAAVPASSTAAGVANSSPATATGYAKLNPPHQPQLTPAQQAAQAALTAGNQIKKDGLVPVRTGLAWAPIASADSASAAAAGASLLSYGGAAALLGGTTGAGAGASGGLAGPGGGGAGSGGGGSRAALAPGVASAAAEAESSLIHATQDLWTTWKSLGLTQLLKKAYKQQQRRAGGSAYGGGAASSSAAAATAAAGPAAASQQASVQLQQTQQTVQAALQQMQAALQQSQVVLQQQLLLSYQQQGGASGSSSGSGAAGGGSGLGGNLTASSLAAVAGAAGPNGAVSNHEATQQWLQQYDSLGLTATITASPLTAGKGAESHVCTASTGGSASLDVLLRRSDQLCFGSGGEQDRSRLIKVVQKLVALGADLSATDNEGRTALHLAAGCGDKAMTLLLVDLGTDVNCRDSVGGTAMHHAAMANKKDMMFALARLGCDWRSRADGIDGATASFVLCGQHGKTTRQQKLLDAKLKRVFQEGAAARAAGRNPLADPASTRDDERDEEGATVDLEAEQALADAAMAALLEEVEGEADTHPGTGKATKKRRKKKKSKPGEASELLRASPEEAEDAEPAELAGPPQPSATTAAAAAAAAVTAAEGSSAAVPNGTGAAPVAAKARAASPAAAASPAVLAAQSSERSTAHLANGAVALPGSPPKQPGQPMHEQQQPSPHPQQSQAPVSVAMPGPAASLQQRQQLPGQPESHAAVAVPAGQVPPPAADAAASSVSGSGSEASEHELVRLHLEQAAEQAAKLVGGEGVGEEPSEAELAGCLQMLDEAISRAVGVGVSAKYGKKVRRKAQTVLDRLRGVVSPEPGSSSAQQQAEEGTGEAAAGAAAGGLVRQGLRAGSPAPPSPVIGGSAGMRGSVAASGAQGRLLLDQQLHQRDSGGAAAAAAAPLSFAAARQAQQQLQALSDEEMARMLQAQFDAEAAVEHSQQAQRRRGAQPGAATAPGQSAISSVLPAPSSAARTAKAEPPAAAPVPTAAQQQAGGGRAQAAPRVTVAPAPQAPLNQHAAVPAVKPQATKYVPPGVKATALVAAAPHASQAAAAKPPPPGYAPPMAAAGAASSGVQGPPVSQGKGALTGHARAQPVQLPQQPLQQSQRAASAGLGAAAGTGALPAASQLQQHAKPAAPAAPGAARAWQPPQQQQQQQQVYPLQHPLPHLVHPPASAASAMPGPPRILTPAPSVGHQQANLASTMQQQQQQQRPLSRGPASPARPPSSLASPLHQPAGSAFGSVGSLFTSAVGSSGTLFGSAAGPAEQAASHSAGLSLGSLGPNAESTSLGGVSDPGLPPTSFAGMFGASAFGPPSPGLGAPRLPTSLPPPAPSLFASSSQPPQSLQQAPAHFGAPLRATEAPSGYNVPCTRMPAAAAAAAGVGPSAAMIGQFADLDISELQQAAYDSFLSGTAGPEGLSSLIPQDLAAQVFGSDASLGGLRHSQLGAGVGRGIGPTGDFADPPSQRQQQQQQDLLDEDTSAAGTLLSSDLLGEIDGFNGGTGSVGGSGEGQPLAPRGQRQPLGAGVLSLPEDAAALFAPSQPPTSTAGLAGAQSGSFIARGSMWR